ncbi:MAG: trypsin-like peptidase domain-containing protein [Ornithinibacter sp.]
MTSEHEPGRDDWSPWGRPEDDAPSGERAAVRAPTGPDAGGPEHAVADPGAAQTAEIPQGQATEPQQDHDAQQASAYQQAPAFQTTPSPVWATSEAAPTQPAADPYAADRYSSDRYAAGPPADPYTAGRSADPYAAGPSAAYDPYAAAQPAAASTPGPAYPSYPSLTTPAPESGSGRRGPGWGALIGVAMAVALLAGLVGGLLGGALADRGTSSAGSGPNSAPAPSAGAGATARPNGSVANIAARATPSVVTLRVTGADGSGTGSGWVYDDSGHIVTNNHVVAGAADGGKITVVLANGQQVPAKVVGRDQSYDLAVVKVDRTDLVPLNLGRSSDVVVGDEVIAVGAPLGLDSTVTAGIVSALNRPVTPGAADDQSYINAIQTDAAINPGNSGGPLLDMQGQVIGVNSAIATAPGSSTSAQSGNIGVGFAIPSDQVRTVAIQLIKTGKAVHPVIGVYLDSSYTGEGVRIADEGPNGDPAVNPGGPADRAGLKAGDVVVKFEGKPVSEGGELVVAIRARAVGDTVTLTVLRDGSERDVTMKLEGSAG